MLNNDVVVTDAWLDQLIALVNAKPRGTSGERGVESVENGKECGAVGGERGEDRTGLDFHEAVASKAIGLVGPMSTLRGAATVG